MVLYDDRNLTLICHEQGNAPNRGWKEMVEFRLNQYEAAQVVLEDRWKFVQLDMKRMRLTVQELIGMIKQCQVERSLLWEITGILAATDNDLRVGNQLLYSKSKIINQTNRLQPCPH